MNLLPNEPTGLTFESPRIEAEWRGHSLDTLARLMVVQAAAFAASTLDWTFHFTCIYRTRDEDMALGGSGVHSAWRAADVRTKDRPPSDVVNLAAHVNGLWAYDLSRPRLLACYTAEHGTGPHAHFQVHPATTPRLSVRAA